MTRRKSPPATAPQTLPEAIADVVRYGQIDTELGRLATDAKQSIADIKAAHDALAKPMEQELKSLYNRLRTWWAVASDALLKPGQKSTELAGVKIGLRMTTPKLGTAEKTDALSAARLASAGLHQFVRIEISPDKAAILQALKAPKTADETAIAQQLSALGFRRDQKEEFFLARPETLPAVETVAVPEIA